MDKPARDIVEAVRLLRDAFRNAGIDGEFSIELAECVDGRQLACVLVVGMSAVGMRAINVTHPCAAPGDPTHFQAEILGVTVRWPNAL
jgi:hypothetical protein